MLTLKHIQQRVTDAKQLQIVGTANATQKATCIEMSQYAGVIEYHPEELVITVKAGTRIEQLDKTLAEHQQATPFAIASGGSSTIGGAYAMGNSSLRDAILGIKIIDGQGRLLTFGGQVMKNVAGYDVSRLLVGSKGKFAIICEISIKVIPQTYQKQLHQRTVVQNKNTSPTRAGLEQGLKNIFDPNGIFI